MNKFQETYGDNVVEIVKIERNPDGEGDIGRPTEAGYRFYSNYRKSLLPSLMEIFKEAGFPNGSVGIAESATGYDEGTGITFPVTDCVGIYFDRNRITNDMMQIYNHLTRDLYLKLLG